MPEDRRPMDRYLDRLERLLMRCSEADKTERKQRRAAERQKKQEAEGRAESDPSETS